MIKRSLLFVLLIFSGIVMAQTNISVSGIVIDKSTQSVVEGATVRILNAKDSSLVTGAVSNSAGGFSFSLNKARYILKVSFLGYDDQCVNISGAQLNNQLGRVVIHESGVLLKEAVVTAKAVEVAVKGDTVEYNAASYKPQPSDVLEDLLKKMPGATVADDGTITINGKQVTKILVDGKEFFSDDPKVASKNLPASIIEKLQVLDRKSDMTQMTGFDDGNDETVINLTVKKGMKQGLFGNAYAGYGDHGRYEANGMVSYMQNDNQFTLLGGSNNTNNAGFSDIASNTFGGLHHGMNFGGTSGLLTSSTGGFNFATQLSSKLKWGGNVRFGDTNNDVYQIQHTQYLGGNQITNKQSIGINKSDNTNLNLRFEWSPDSLTKVIFTPTIQYNTNRNIQNAFAETLANATDSLNWSKSVYEANGTSTNLGGELEISRQLNKKGRVLSFDFNGGRKSLTQDALNYSETDFREARADSASIIDQRIHQRNNGYNWSALVSYVEPIGHNNFLQLTYQYANTYSVADKNSYTRDADGSYTILSDNPGYTRKLENDFINQNIGLNFKAIRAKYDLTVGVALKPASYKSTTYFVDSIQTIPDRHVINFTPSARFNYNWSKNENLRIDYRGTTIQPTTMQLATYDNTDPLNITQGNIALKPSFQNQLRIRYRNFDRSKQSAFIIYGRLSVTNNDIVNSTTTYLDGSRLTTYQNANGTKNGILRFIVNQPLKNKKFSVSSFFKVDYADTKSFIYNQEKGVSPTDSPILVGGLNQSQTLGVGENLGVQYRSDLFDFGLKGNVQYNDVVNSIQKLSNQKTWTYGAGPTTSVYIPGGLTFNSDLTYSTNKGYTAGYQLNQWIWNASISKTLFKAKNGTIRFKMYDILHQMSNISRTTTSNSITDVTTNTLGSYFMVHFIYKFQFFKGGAKASDVDTEHGFGGRRHW